MTFRKSSFEQDPMEATGSFTGTFVGPIESASFAETASFALNAGGGGGGDESLESGVPATIDGVAVGFTDFSEFAITSTRPSGITFFASGGQPDPTSESIRLDPGEGQYFSMDGHGQSLWAYGVDSFDGQLEFGELLVRIWISAATLNLRDIGPALSLTGSQQADTSFMNAHVLHSVPFDTILARVTSGSNGTFAGGDIQEANQTNAWAWMRYRRTASSDPAFDDMEVRTWYGDIEDEPASPDASSLGNFSGNPRGLHALGWGGFVIPPLEQKIAYLAFSDDPVAVPPPVPVPGPGGLSGSFSGSVTGTFIGDSDATGTLTGTFIGDSNAIGSFTGAFTGTLLGAITGQAAVLAEPWTTTTGSAAGALLPFNANLFTLGELAAHHAGLVNELLIVGAQHVVPALLSGVPKEVSSGKWIGGTNFSEFEVSATLPAGLTLYDDTFNGGTPSIENDAIEGNYWAMVGAGIAGRYGIGVDAFFGISGLNCEVLVRTHMAGFTSGNRYWPGPGCNITGSTDATFRAVMGRLKWTSTPPNSLIIVAQNPTAGGGSTLASGTSSESDIASGDWVWFRMRRQETVSPVAGNARIKLKVWKGALSAEPEAWDVEVTHTGGNADEDDGAVGWTGDWFTPDAGEHGIAFMSFTNDPEVTPPPTPDEIA